MPQLTGAAGDPPHGMTLRQVCGAGGVAFWKKEDVAGKKMMLLWMNGAGAGQELMRNTKLGGSVKSTRGWQEKRGKGKPSGRRRSRKEGGGEQREEEDGRGGLRRRPEKEGRKERKGRQWGQVVYKPCWLG